MNLERCCMCPNEGTKNQYSTICPGIPNTPHPKPTACKFVHAKKTKLKRSVRAKKL